MRVEEKREKNYTRVTTFEEIHVPRHDIFVIRLFG